MYRRILLPTDGSAGAEQAIDHALALADRLDATVHVVYIVDTDALALDVRSRQLAESMASEGRREVEALIDRARRLGLDPVLGEVLEGSPSDEILSYADEHEVDLIVMGTHGRRGLDRYLLGSVTERVVRRAAVPVLTVRRQSARRTE